MSVGTFVYIAASEVIVEEFAKPKVRIAKFVAFIIGIATIALLMLWGHDHGSEDDDEDHEDHDH